MVGVSLEYDQRSIQMMDPVWLVLLLPLAYLHGWYTGKSLGVRQGAMGMFDELYSNGKPVKGKQFTRKIEISLEDGDS